MFLLGIFQPYLQLLAAEFSGHICSYLPGFSGLTFSGTRRPGFSGRICCFWPGFSGRSFSGMGNLKNSMGSRQIVLVSTAGFSVLNTGIFWREAKTKRPFSQCTRWVGLFQQNISRHCPYEDIFSSLRDSFK